MRAKMSKAKEIEFLKRERDVLAKNYEYFSSNLRTELGNKEKIIAGLEREIIDNRTLIGGLLVNLSAQNNILIKAKTK